MPTQWTLTLTPPPSEPVSPRHLHALACRLFETPADDHTAQAKPFTAALVDRRLVLSHLDDPAAPDVPGEADGTVRLGTDAFRLDPIDRRAEPYERLTAVAPAVKARVGFATPTYVNRSGRQLPLPDPELLMGGLARRWAAFSPLPLPPESVAEALESVHLARHDIRTRVVGEGSAQRVGFVGDAVFGMAGHPSPGARRVFATLWSFAAFAGIGAQTTHGLGHVRVHLHRRTGTDGSGATAENTDHSGTTRTTDRSRTWNGAR
ncbi:CRISPR system precrRNA processing endoribonuclease RAMP protein Cas6 [Nocardiopsis lambiniae]|uniref:CRISPR system precrRNA processing endoribonuclease RAMP protein Cas6 n=1 Tax=Nocardiopsis lambiniae TaxID=3075539 RepID=A0ABU2M9K1_9ACTN|nr:CRISPR system precrRNA processing endoribonuclease RAMP protein Cas6 [Nocardiopsis sp. DSM 44743]MDT0329348.1 CRISPR system precrRNA processing endoribonuclease RAMP protein Cas6 [Nocardiopsis sp. DSM 44743]